jgi:hypothetical protein
MLLAIKPVLVFNTLIGANIAPVGVIAVRLVVDADDTVAFVDPKNTILLFGVALKPVPVIVISDPTFPFVGLIDEIVWAITWLLNDISSIANILAALFEIIFVVRN